MFRWKKEVMRYKKPTPEEMFNIFIHDKTNLADPEYKNHKIPTEFLQYEIVEENPSA